MTTTHAPMRAAIGDDLAWYRRGDQDLHLADAIDAGSGAAMTVGFARYAAGESNPWVMTYDEALVVTQGRFAVDVDGEATVASAGEVIYLRAGTELTYRAETDVELVYVSYPHWMEATEQSPQAHRLEEFIPE
jgi:ethanolamine utilization protein EutQ